MSEDKRQDDELELTNESADEELMSDFKELFPEEEEPEEQAGERDASEALEELDAFLDDFEQGVEPAEEGPGKEEESAQLELKEDELDLAVSQPEDDTSDDENVPSSQEVEALSEPEAVPEFEELVTDVEPHAEPDTAFTARREPELPLDESFSAAAGVAGAAATAEAEQGPAMPSAAHGKGLLLLVAGGLGIAVLLSAVALWLGLGVTGRLDGIELRLSQLQQRTVAQPSADTAQMRTELQQLAQRVSELAVIIEGPISHLRQSNEESLTALSRRIEHLEQTIKGAPVNTRAGTTSAPASPGAGSGGAKAGWVINLLSLSNQKDAQTEMERLRKAGVRVEVKQAISDGKTWYRLRVPGFATYEGAKAYIDTVEKQAGVKNAWVAKE
jgi:cell division septation protein DedD